MWKLIDDCRRFTVRMHCAVSVAEDEMGCTRHLLRAYARFNARIHIAVFLSDGTSWGGLYRRVKGAHGLRKGHTNS